MRARVLSAIAGSLLAVTALGLALSAAPAFWVTATQAEFLKGRVEHVTVDTFGRATLGPSLSLLADPATAVVWSLATDAAGTLYAGTGHDGRVFKLTPTGAPTVWFDSAEPEVHAMTAAPGGGLFVATSPEGRIYRVSATGEATPFYDPEERYIWALATDSAGRLYAATGDRGVIYRISPTGQGAVLFASKADHVTGLATRPDGTVLATTAGPGRLFSVGSDGKGFLLLDSGFPESAAAGRRRLGAGVCRRDEWLGEHGTGHRACRHHAFDRRGHAGGGRLGRCRIGDRRKLGRHIGHLVCRHLVGHQLRRRLPRAARWPLGSPLVVAGCGAAGPGRRRDAWARGGHVA